ncbi:hypothetical protein BU24DRAFT_450596 [Aaosphaeria arxii CBS 175.79]|uniref:Uncharacterized protein n=1 Tax=Aaosphaeria arxii CBS 175.79 TaxID=1450172 RepID=A0A6A5XT35_9PLEO|nr:uncharacterized protein BU24DRAFT_450596 [Aaosphaeria arxii CBS 175.79]KAF2015977.1 hypothetical protein BU24DRAFT_450596 [Aaosphaeria arxii CBS 175.79]
MFKVYKQRQQSRSGGGSDPTARSKSRRGDVAAPKSRHTKCTSLAVPRTRSSNHSLFFTIPRELRNLVYHELWKQSPTVWKVPYKQLRFQVVYEKGEAEYNGAHKLPIWLLTCQCILAEGLDQLHSRSRWSFGSDKKVRTYADQGTRSPLICCKGTKEVILKLSSLILEPPYDLRARIDPLLDRDLQTIAEILYQSTTTRTLCVRFGVSSDLFSKGATVRLDLARLNIFRDLPLEKLEFQVYKTFEIGDNVDPSSTTADDDEERVVDDEIYKTASRLMGASSLKDDGIIRNQYDKNIRIVFTRKGI